jgi:protein involved in polysaccharide export with SLBB domain
MGVIPTPSIFELAPKRNNSLQEVIQLAGGLSALNSPSKATLERIENGAVNPLTAYTIDLQGEGIKMTLKDGDMVTLMPINPSFSNAVSLRILNNTVRLPLQGSSKIADLIPNKQALITPDYYFRRFNVRVVPSGEANPSGSFGGSNSNNDLDRIRNNALSDQFNLESIMIERTSPQSLTPQIIMVNLNTVWSNINSDQNITLQPGDIISVYSQKDIQVPIDRQSKIVRIQGEVNAPGIYQLQGGETLQQLIAKAGGVSDKAYLYGTQLSRESVKESQKKNIEVVVRRLESQLAIEGAQGITNLSAPVQEQQAQVLLRTQNQARIREKITQLRTAVPSGRVVLDLDPKRTQLPELVLEQGDQVMIPSVPSVVSAIGAVYNENALIFNSEKTVTDYLKIAGVTPNADLDSTFIVRADGSLLAPNPNASFFASSGKVDNERLMPGDLVFVPEKIYKETAYSVFMRGLRDWTQILYQFGLGAAGIKILRD